MLIIRTKGRTPCTRITRYRSPGPHSHITRGICSFPSPKSPPPGPLLSRVLDTIGNYNNNNKKGKIPLSGFYREIFPRLRPQIPPFPRKWKYAYGLLMHSIGGGGGGQECVPVSVTIEEKKSIEKCAITCRGRGRRKGQTRRCPQKGHIWASFSIHLLSRCWIQRHRGVHSPLHFSQAFSFTLRDISKC